MLPLWDNSSLCVLYEIIFLFSGNLIEIFHDLAFDFVVCSGFCFLFFLSGNAKPQYACSDGADPLIIDGKIALLRKGLLFYREQVKKAVAAFQKVSQEDNDGNICTDLEDNGAECELDEDIEDVYSVSNEEDDGADVDSVGGDEADPVSSKITVPLC